MKTNMLKTDNSNLSYFMIRITLALVILPHGLQKLFGTFGGFGFDNSMKYFTETVGLPWILGFLVIAAETFGMLLLAAGIFSRLVAASLIVVMFGAASVNVQNGFFMNWFGNQPGEGVEFFILVIAMALLVTIQGGGKWSVDGWLAAPEDEKNKSAIRSKFETTV